MAIGTRSGWLYAWHTKGTTDSQIQWESYHHDNRNTGNYDVPLEQGNPDAKAAQPLTEAMCAERLGTEDLPPLEPGGGCGACVVGHETPDDRGAWLALLGLGLLLRRRRY